MTYYGDTPEKIIARTTAAMTALRHFRNVNPESELKSAVTLAGPEAGDMGVLKHHWNVPGKRAHFVDSKKIHYLEAKAKLDIEWPEAQVHHSNLERFLKGFNEGIDYLIMDLMGQFTESVWDIASAASRLMLPGSIVSYTYYPIVRHKECPFWIKTEPYGRLTSDERLTFGPEKTEALIQERRKSVGYTRLLCQALTGEDKHFKWIPVGKFKYHMGIVLVQKVPVTSRYVGYCGDPIVITNDRQDEQYRDLVCKLQAMGHNSKAISEIMNFHQPRVAAFMANNTMGRYAAKQ